MADVAEMAKRMADGQAELTGLKRKVTDAKLALAKELQPMTQRIRVLEKGLKPWC